MMNLEPSWRAALSDEWAQPYFVDLQHELARQRANGVTIYPPEPLIFQAFQATPLAHVKVVILGQDPYHQPNQAMGLSFSVPMGCAVPPSLRTVYRELAQSYPDFAVPLHGDLTRWAQQGVLLLNAALTVAHGQAGSHAKIGWQTFTDAVIRCISRECDGVIFLLWGNFAKQKTSLIDASRHPILTAAHPSPLARGAFMGCGHFTQTNALLRQHGKAPIDWQI
ncbi:MAG: uracil-DNA glycosylase [Formosimonas sp.]